MKYLLCTICLLITLTTMAYADTKNLTNDQSSETMLTEKLSKDSEASLSLKQDTPSKEGENRYEPSFDDFWLYFVLFAPVALIIVTAIASWRKRQSS